MESVTILASPAKRNGFLSESNMRWYLGGQLFSLMGTMLQSAVLSLLVTNLCQTKPGDAPFWIGVVWATSLLPGFFLAPVAGIYVDRVNKPSLLKLTSVLGLLQAFALAGLTALDMITIPLVCLLALVMGFINAFDGPGRNAIIKDAIVDPDNLRPATSAFSSLYNLAQIVGPGLAGPLVIACGFSLAFFINGLSFLAVVVALFKMKFNHLESVERPLKAESGLWLEARVGFAHIFAKRSLGLCIIMSAVICIAGYSYNIILPIIAREMFSKAGDYRQVFSWLGVSTGLGTLLGSLAVIRWINQVEAKHFVVVGAGLAGVCFFLFSATGDLKAGIVLIFLIGFGFMASFSVIRSSVMHLADRQLVGRVIGVNLLFFFGGIMITSLMAGWLATHFGCPFVLRLSGVGMIAIALITPFLPGIDEVR